jgi:hypothetical protein
MLGSYAGRPTQRDRRSTVLLAIGLVLLSARSPP